MAENGQVGTGTTIVFGTSSWAGDVRSITGSGNDGIEDINISHLGTTGYHKKIPTTIKDGGTYAVEGFFDPTLVDLVTGVEESVVIDWAGSGKTDTFPAYATNFVKGAPFEDAMPFTFDLTVSGDVVKVRV